ncbi:hypothetical protein F5148DRAFT_1189030 [Russula earlei]|uniref:Uncharacterized protein n=1 Tax=Russula earlei TaxID=71964 RepID=A0ACC0UC28_9AGAM|nr:hypothetical protein F5148DRAFT_1189030 [Russula earlei]
MPSFSAWYSQQYAAWNRTRRLRASPYLARTDTNTSRRATALATGTTNAPSATNNVEANLSEPPKERKQETLFGPSIGIVSYGPAWAQSQDAKNSPSSDYLTPEIVRRWMETSKETIQPTTTLQALVNLKRPTLRLLPLEIRSSDDQPDDPANSESRNNHALEFEYDCDAPKCCIRVQVIIPSNDPNPHGNSLCITVYESVFEGGFGRLLKLEDGAMIDLGRLEHAAAQGGQVDVGRSSPKVDKDVTTAEATELPEASSQRNVTPTPTPDHQDNVRKRRFTALQFRRRSQQNPSVSGPALAVLDNDATATTEGGHREKDLLNDDGVRVAIQLFALDDFGKELSSVNRQTTYLHVVRLGLGGEDSRSWVVKVVKREATIGPHTFHLHEIYGLSSSTQPPAPAVNPIVHTYPPTVPAEDEPSSECLVCLSSPREVVLLPCRHLVACKDCAINMIEFGAGGAIVHAEEPTTTSESPQVEVTETPAVGDSVPPDVATRPPEGDAAGPAAVPENEAGHADLSAAEPSQIAVRPALDEDPVASTAPTSSQAGPATVTQPTITTDPQNGPAPQNPRRKRRAKGWSCPVCRQPYTSLLRITTMPSTMDLGKEGKRVSTSTIDHPLATTVHVAPVAGAGLTAHAPALESTLEEPAPAALPPPTRSSRSLRSGFFSALSRRPADPVSPV